MPREVSLRRVAWSGAALGAVLIIIGWVLAPAPGSNYADVLADQAWRIAAGMWVSAGIGIGIPAAVYLLEVARRMLGRRGRAESAGAADRGGM